MNNHLVRTYLVLVDGPVDPDAVERLAEFGTSEIFHLVFAAREPTDAEQHLITIEGSPDHSAEPAAVVLARWRARHAVTAMRAAGFSAVTTNTGPADPVAALDDALADDSYDDVIVISQPAKIAQWLHVDLASRIQRHTGREVIHIESDQLSPAAA